MTLDGYKAILAKPGVAARNPELSAHTVCAGQAPVMEPAFVDVSLGSAQVQAPSKARFRVLVCSVRQRLIDEDNLSVKFLVDQLRYAGLIHDDNPALTTISVTQRKCAKGEPEHVQVTIEKL